MEIELFLGKFGKIPAKARIMPELFILTRLGIWERNKKSKCKMQNCGGPSGGFVLKKRKTGGILGGYYKKATGKIKI
jgi:hypothetical protein